MRDCKELALGTVGESRAPGGGCDLTPKPGHHGMVLGWEELHVLLRSDMDSVQLSSGEEFF